MHILKVLNDTMTTDVTGYSDVTLPDPSGITPRVSSRGYLPAHLETTH